MKIKVFRLAVPRSGETVTVPALVEGTADIIVNFIGGTASVDEAIAAQLESRDLATRNATAWCGAMMRLGAQRSAAAHKVRSKF